MELAVKDYNLPSKKYLKNTLSIKRAPTTSYNNQIYRRASTTRIDIEKAHYEAESLMDEQDDSKLMKNQFMFERKDVNILKFYCHLLEPIDYLYLVLGFIGLL